MIGHLKDVFPNVLALAISTIITPTILEFIHKSLKLRPLTRLYRELLDKPNFTYIFDEITKSKHEDLAFLILKKGRVDAIANTIVFIDDIKDAWCITAYL